MITYSKEMKELNNEIREWKEKDNRRLRKYLDTMVICKCGRRVTLPAYKDSTICDWCGKKVNNTSRQHFKLKMMDLLVKQQIEEDVKKKEVKK